MSEFIDSEASEGEDEEELTARDKKKLKKMNKNRLQDSSEEEEGNMLSLGPSCQGCFRSTLFVASLGTVLFYTFVQF